MMSSNLPAYRPDRSVIVLSHVPHSIMGDVADPTFFTSHQLSPDDHPPRPINVLILDSYSRHMLYGLQQEPSRTSGTRARDDIEHNLRKKKSIRKRKKTWASLSLSHAGRLGKLQAQGRKVAPRHGPKQLCRTSLSRMREIKQDVAESDEEDQVAEDPPPVKRVRPSPDADGDVESEEPILAAKGRKAPSRSRRTDRNIVKDESDMQVDNPNASEDDKPATRRRTGLSANRKSVAAPSKRPRVARTSKTARGSSCPIGRRSRRLGSFSQRSGGSSATHLRTVLIHFFIFQQTIQLLSIGSHRPPRSRLTHRRVGYVVATQPLKLSTDATDATDENNEAPLDAPPQRLSQAAPVAAEPEGPKARLVIHKMVLVNFKSYAGGQDIGPFHKVCPIRRTFRNL